MCHQRKSFSCNAIFTNFRLQRFCSLSRGFVGFHFSTIFCFESLFISILWLCHHFRDTGMNHPLERPDASISSNSSMSACHKSFQFSLCVFENFWINEVNSTQFSSIVKFWLFFCLFFGKTFLDSERLYHFLSSFGHSCSSRFWKLNDVHTSDLVW